MGSGDVYKRQELDFDDKLSSDNKQLPYKEMTGKRKDVRELSLEAMRNLRDWSRFSEEMPPSDMGLQRLSNIPNLELNSLEKSLWNLADGSISLKKIAIKIGLSLEKVEQTALSMIFVELIEEVPVTIPTQKKLSIPGFGKQSALVGQNSKNTLSDNKSKVSSSFINNLVGFLRNNF